jgi:hypothetical protein
VCLQIPHVAHRPPHIFDGVHAGERGLNRVNGGRRGVDCGLTSRLAGDPGIFARDPRPFANVAEEFPLLANGFERLAVLIANLARVFGHATKRFAFGPCRFFGCAVDFSANADIFRLLTPLFGLLRRDEGLIAHVTLLS